MRICNLCCKEMKEDGNWRIKEGKVEDYCSKCTKWLMCDYEIQDNEENARRIVREVKALMDERRYNLEKLQKWVSEELELRIKREENGE